MKRGLLWGIVCIVVGIFVFEQIKQDPGYVLIRWHSYTVELRLWFALAVFLLVGITAVFIVVIVKKIGRTLLHGQAWFSDRRAHSIEQRYREGLLHFFSDNWSQASKSLQGVSKKNDLPVVRVVAMALALAQQSQIEEALTLLKDAEADFPTDRVWLLKARLKILLAAPEALSSKHIEDVEMAYQSLCELAPREPMLASYELSVYTLKNKQSSELSLLPSPKKTLANTSQSTSAQAFFVESLLRLSRDNEPSDETLATLWAQVPKSLKQEANVVLAYAKVLLKQGNDAELEPFIAMTLERQWQPALVDMYAKLNSSDKQLQLKKAERWLKPHLDCPTLLHTLAVLSLKNQLWGKARGYLEQSLALNESSQAHYLLGVIAEKLDDDKGSNDHYKKAAALAAQFSAL